MKNSTNIKVPNVSEIIDWNTPVPSKFKNVWVGTSCIFSPLPKDKNHIPNAPKTEPAS